MKLLHHRHGSAPGKRAGASSTMSVVGRALGGWLAIAAVAGGLGAAAFVTPGLAANATEPSGAVRTNAANGAELFLQNCAACHGPQGQGGSGGPSLITSGAAAADFYLTTGRMPVGAPNQRPVRQPPRFDDEQIQALVEHVASFDNGPPIPQVSGGGDLHRGWELYTANCAACHAATGAGNAVGGGFVAYGLGRATDRQIAEAMIVGPGVMPIFDFADADRDAIIEYVRYLRSEPTPGGAPIGGIGPVAEGFVSVVGGRSDTGQPDAAEP
jgi:ubiquinol-cytochrome c reductase cytochrome c subunit